MAFSYDPSPETGALRQGEIVSNLWEYQPVSIDEEPKKGQQVPVIPVHHPLCIVMTADCDLEWDFDARFQESTVTVARDDSKAVLHVLLCEAFAPEEIHDRAGVNTDIMRQIRKNNDERYHCLPDASNWLPEIVLDFKKLVGIPTHLVYQCFQNANAKRLGIVGAPYLYQLMHRFYGFQSRVGVPEIE